MFTIIKVVFELLGIIHTEYENCFIIVISLAIIPRNKAPPIAILTTTFLYPSDS